MNKALLLAVFTALALPYLTYASIDSNLSYGSHGQEVTELQEYLIANNYLTGTATGNFFSLTLKAVKAYQSDHSIPSTGYVGSLTRGAINKDLEADLAPSQAEQIQETGTTTVENSNSQAYKDAVARSNALSSQLQAMLDAQANPTSPKVEAPIVDTVPPVINTLLYDRNGNGQSILIGTNEPSLIQVSFLLTTTPGVGTSESLTEDAKHASLIVYATSSLVTKLQLDTTTILQNHTSYYFSVKAIDAAGNVSLPQTSNSDNTSKNFWSAAQYITTSF